MLCLFVCLLAHYMNYCSQLTTTACSSSKNNNRVLVTLQVLLINDYCSISGLATCYSGKFDHITNCVSTAFINISKKVHVQN